MSKLNTLNNFRRITYESEQLSKFVFNILTVCDIGNFGHVTIASNSDLRTQLLI